MRGGDEFISIADARTCYVGRLVSLIAPAVEVSIHKSTRGTDYFRSVRIIDDSHPAGIFVHFYAGTMEDLPSPRCAGDILLVSRIKIVPRDGKDVYANFIKGCSAFAFFHAVGSNPYVNTPYQNSLKFTIEDVHMRYIDEARRCSQALAENIDGLHPILSLSEIIQDEELTVLCKIVHIAEIQKDEWMLFLWDGTDAPPAYVDGMSVVSFFEDEMENPLPLVVEPFPLSRDILCTFPHVGTVLRMVVDHQNVKLGIKFIRANVWVKFISIKCQANAGMWRAVLTPHSKICYVADDHNTVMQRQRSHEKRIQSKWGSMPLPNLPWPVELTVIARPDVPIVTLMYVLTYPQVPMKFRCVVQVVSLIPWRAEDFRSPCGLYRMRFTLEDPNARLHSYLYGEDGDKLFKDFKSIDEQGMKRNVLVGVGVDGVENVGRNPPWFHCCLKSYQDDLGRTNYRICDTWLI